jgi:hypothetical protein
LSRLEREEVEEDSDDSVEESSELASDAGVVTAGAFSPVEA